MIIGEINFKILIKKVCTLIEA